MLICFLLQRKCIFIYQPSTSRLKTLSSFLMGDDERLAWTEQGKQTKRINRVIYYHTKLLS